MATQRTKLELTWIGKEHRPKLEPRVLVEEAGRSYHAARRVSDGDIFDNRLIRGDNLLALKALEQEFTGKVNCIYIDPPFNTGQAFAQYEDGLEHSLWLSMMRDRLVLLKRLLGPKGTIWVHCDDNEQAYLKAVMDELFGRDCFITTIIWQKVDSPNDNKVPITPDHDYILGYMRSLGSGHLRQMENPALLDAYSNSDDQGRFYRDRLLKKNGKSSLRTDRPSMYFPIKGPDGIEVYPIHDDGREARWALGIASVNSLVAEGALIWKQRERAGQVVWVPYTREYAPDSPMQPYPSIWLDVHTSRQAKAHLTQLFPGETPFSTPKPEPLLRRILEMTTNPGDLVLDSFAGSGTTGAVAQKMGRRWIMVELGEHCHTHIIPRLKKVIDGEDAGGITEAVGWRGGGGFRYYRLAPSLLERDAWGNWVISKEFNPALLAEAVCKLEGFMYAPSESVYWQQGHSTETDYIYVTTQTLTREQLQHLSEDVGEKRSLLVYCGAYRGKAEAFPNLTVKKIPKAVLTKCEWGRDDYSLEVAELPALPSNGQTEAASPVLRGRARKRKADEGQAELF